MAKAKNKTIYVCQSCGAQRSRWEGKCSDCGSWNSLVEETFTDTSSGYGGKSAPRGWVASNSSAVQTIRLDQNITEIKMNRMSTQISELDRVLGGGLAESSFVLLGGAPGIGKSTLLLQMAAESNMNLILDLAKKTKTAVVPAIHPSFFYKNVVKIVSALLFLLRWKGLALSSAKFKL